MNNGFRFLLLGLALVFSSCQRPSSSVAESASLLSAGPMLGYSEMREVVIWVQTKAPATVQIAYWEKGKTDTLQRTAPVQTLEATAYTAHMLTDRVKPGLTYEYALEINGEKVPRPYLLEFKTRPLWEWRSVPPDFTIAAGSCNYVNETEFDRPGKPYGSEYEIFTTLHAQRPDLMLWLGDNVYLREADWNTRTGILARYTHDRAQAELQPLLASTHHYAIWDDHDFGSNDSDRSHPYADLSFEAFKLFWANSSYGLNGKPAVNQHFQWGDVDVIMLDDRIFRSAEYRTSGERQLLGTEQIEWAIDRLKAAETRFGTKPKGNPTFKLLVMGGQWLSNNPDNKEAYASPAFKDEQAYFLKRLAEEKIGGVLFLSGDLHRGEMNRIERPGLYPLNDITTSSLTAGTNKRNDPPWSTLVPGTLITQHNFALLHFSGPPEDRKLTIKMMGPKGELWNAAPGSTTEVDAKWIFSANALQAPKTEAVR